MQVGFFYKGGLSSRLTRFFTGSSCYHVGFVTDDLQLVYDMHFNRRRRPFTYPADSVVLVACPVEVLVAYLEDRLTHDKSFYGWRDYLGFGLRWFYHRVGKSTRNAGGIICSELVADDLRACGWPVTFPEVPSPADLELALLGVKDAINTPRWSPASRRRSL